MTGFNRYPLDQLDNKDIDNTLSAFGRIIVPTGDVYGGNFFLTGKKKVKIDLNQGKTIPRDLFIEFKTDKGKTHSTSIRTYYKGQPYYCKRCSVKHVGDCPEWLKDKEEKTNAYEFKKDKVRTTMIGDSNFRCLNEKGLMATVTSITGGKIRHICNQIKHENLTKTENVVLSAGQNCLNEIGGIGKMLGKKKPGRIESI